MFRAGGAAALLASVAAQGSVPSFTGTATTAGPVTGTVVVPELASAPKSIAVYWAFDKEGKNLSDAPFASKDYSIVNRRTCGDTGSVPGQRRLEPAGGGDVADPKIVNGENAGICKLKWQVSLQQDGSHFCGATILSPKWVMSAAHCKWEDQDVNTITVVAGEYNLDNRESHQVTRKIKQVKVFPNYNDATTSGDYMLLELAEDLPFGDCIGAACLPSAAAAPGTDCLISGWGALKSEGESPVILQVATVKIVSNSDCEKNSGGEYSIDKFMICAQGGSVQTGIKDACQGDSGGPLVCKDSSGKYALQGATSFGNGCAQPEFAGVYARIAAVLDWIKTTTGLEPGNGEKASTVPISGATPPEGATGLAVFAVAADGKRTPLGVIALAAAAATTTTTTTTKPTPTATSPTQISGSWRAFLSGAFFAFPVAAHLWATVC